MTNEELDKAVAEAQGWKHVANSDWEFMRNGAMWLASQYHPSTNWQQAGELVEKYEIDINLVQHDITGEIVCAQASGSSPVYDIDYKRAICLAVLAAEGVE